MSAPDPVVEHLRAATLAAASGAAATAALLLSPVGQGIPPIELPPWPIDLRLVLLPSIFTVAHVTLARVRWPIPALVLPALALLVASIAHFQASALVDFLTAFQGSEAGERIDLLPTLATGASLLLALAASLDRARDKMASLARRAGAPEHSIAHLRAAATAQANQTLGFAGAAFVAFALVARVGDAAFGGAQAPLPELVGAAVAVGVAVLLFPGVVANMRAAAQER